jgi:predicted  nucleic acid-binding Zn-ribbon protein
VADDLKTLSTKVVSGAVGAAFQARDRATRAQTAALEVLNLPTADDVQRLTRRVRDISQRLERVEDGVDGTGTKLDRLAELERRLSVIEAALVRIEAAVLPGGGIDAER